MTIPESIQTKTPLTFASLINDPALVKALLSLNITEPTEVQALIIPFAMQNKDLIVQAQTGSGKTFAFMLPILAKIRSEAPTRSTVALIITPTRELALQVKKVTQSIAPDITPACLIGGTSSREQEKQLRKDERIIVGTPGRLLDFISQRLIILRKCKTFVLDEADEMLSMGFLEEVREILSRLPKERQGMFFSATITTRVSSLAYGFLKNPEKIVVELTKKDQPKIEHFFCKVNGGVASKAKALCHLLSESGEQSAIVFCNTKSDTELVEVYLKRRGFDAAKINADLSQRERDTVMSCLRNGKLRYLIATDVAARGIDIKELEIVVNYSLPTDPEAYVHRTGRTGRAGASGRAISLIGPLDIGFFYSIQRILGVEMKELAVPEEID